MDWMRHRFSFNRRVGNFSGDRKALGLLVLFALFVAGGSWIAMHPEHNPSAPLDLRDPVGWATMRKLAALRDDTPECRAVLERSDVAFSALPAQGEGPCARPDRTQLADFPLVPDTPPMTCPVAAALKMWLEKSVKPAARELMGSPIARIEHYGVFNCRRMRGNDSGAWSEHATGNAIDIAAFVLADGRRVSVNDGWSGDANGARFLREVRDGACGVFATVLSPDYNAAHKDHFHFDQDARWSSVCR